MGGIQSTSKYEMSRAYKTSRVLQCYSTKKPVPYSFLVWHRFFVPRNLQNKLAKKSIIALPIAPIEKTIRHTASMAIILQNKQPKLQPDPFEELLYCFEDLVLLCTRELGLEYVVPMDSKKLSSLKKASKSNKSWSSLAI